MTRPTHGRVGWVSRNAGQITECAHPLEKSASSFTDTSIHRLFYLNFSSSALLGSENNPRNVCRNAWRTVVL
jgi:hypothetical protein